MPQASPKLRAKFPGMDNEALGVLDANFTVGRDGLIRPKNPNQILTQREEDAIDYLFQEWDYGYEADRAEDSRRRDG